MDVVNKSDKQCKTARNKMMKLGLEHSLEDWALNIITIIHNMGWELHEGIDLLKYTVTRLQDYIDDTKELNN